MAINRQETRKELSNLTKELPLLRHSQEGKTLLRYLEAKQSLLLADLITSPLDRVQHLQGSLVIINEILVDAGGPSVL